MKLKTAERISSEHATEEELENAFNDDQGRGEFIILSQSDQVYIQAAGEFNDPYTVEYREGDGDHHFQSAEVTKEVVKSVFMKYLKGDASWQTDLEWEQVYF